MDRNCQGHADLGASASRQGCGGRFKGLLNAMFSISPPTNHTRRLPKCALCSEACSLSLGSPSQVPPILPPATHRSIALIQSPFRLILCEKHAPASGSSCIREASHAHLLQYALIMSSVWRRRRIPPLLLSVAAGGRVPLGTGHDGRSSRARNPESRR
jgi:hypothetical protein